jgi:hypothetical protein
LFGIELVSLSLSYVVVLAALVFFEPEVLTISLPVIWTVLLFGIELVSSWYRAFDAL